MEGTRPVTARALHTEEKTATFPAKLGVTQNHARSQQARSDNDPGESKLPSTTIHFTWYRVEANKQCERLDLSRWLLKSQNIIPWGFEF